MDKFVDIQFVIKDLEGEKMNGMKFGEMLDYVKKESHRLVEKMKEENGDTILREEWTKKLTPDERDVLRISQWIRSFNNGEIDLKRVGFNKVIAE